MKRQVKISVLMFLLCSGATPAPAQTDRASALFAALSNVLRRDSLTCSTAYCPPLGVLVSSVDSAHLDIVRRIGLIPVTEAHLDSLTQVERVLSIQEIRITEGLASVYIEELGAPSSSRTLPLERIGQARFRRWGHGWEVLCAKSEGKWRVVRVIEWIA